MFRRAPLLAGLLLTLGVAQAGERVPLGQAHLGQGLVAVFAVGTYVSDPYMPEDTFVQRLAPGMRAYSAASGMEVGAMICSADLLHRYGVVLQTVDSQLFVPFTTDCPPGMVSTGVTLHTHPGVAVISANAVDVAILGPGYAIGQRMATEGASFSPQDFNTPGYLVTPERVLYQDGPDRVRDLTP